MTGGRWICGKDGRAGIIYRTLYFSIASTFNSIPRPGRVGSGILPWIIFSSSRTSSRRRADSESGAGRNSINGQLAVAAQ